MATNGPKHAAMYGAGHQRLRRQWAAHIAGGGVTCPRCGEIIARDAPSDSWDLGHQDGAASRPEHRACNRATRTHHAQAQDEQPRPTTHTAAYEASIRAAGHTPCPRGGRCPWPERVQLDGTPCACPMSLSANPINRWWEDDDEPAPFEHREPRPIVI